MNNKERVFAMTSKYRNSADPIAAVAIDLASADRPYFKDGTDIETLLLNLSMMTSPHPKVATFDQVVIYTENRPLNRVKFDAIVDALQPWTASSIFNWKGARFKLALETLIKVVDTNELHVANALTMTVAGLLSSENRIKNLLMDRTTSETKITSLEKEKAELANRIADLVKRVAEAERNEKLSFARITDLEESTFKSSLITAWFSAPYWPRTILEWEALMDAAVNIGIFHSFMRSLSELPIKHSALSKLSMIDSKLFANHFSRSVARHKALMNWVAKYRNMSSDEFIKLSSMADNELLPDDSAAVLNESYLLVDAAQFELRSPKFPPSLDVMEDLAIESFQGIHPRILED